MFSPDDLIPMLLEADPDFLPAWQAHLDFWSDPDLDEDDEDDCQGNPRGHFNDASAFAHHLWESLLRGRIDQFPFIFEVFEKVIADSGEDDSVLSASDLVEVSICAGLLYKLNGLGGPHSPYTRFDRDIFMRWLGPASRRAWIEAGYYTGVYNDLMWREYAPEGEAIIDGRVYRTSDSLLLSTYCRIRGRSGNWLYGKALFRSPDGAYYLHRVGRHRHFIRPLTLEQARAMYDRLRHAAVPVNTAFPSG